MRIFAVVDCRVDRYGPHARRVSVAIAVIVLAAVTGGPDIDVAEATATLLVKVKQVAVIYTGKVFCLH